MSRLRFLVIAEVPPDPNAGASGTVYQTNAALRELGHDVDEVWAEQLGPRRIPHGNLHSLLEQPRGYRREVLRAISQKSYDVILMSQPQAYLAAKALKRRGFSGIVLNRSHGVELRADEILPGWQRRLLQHPENFSQRFLSPILRKALARQWPRVAKYCDGIVVGCNLDRAYLIERIPLDPRRVRTIAHGVHPAFCETPQAPISRERCQRLLFVGQTVFFKGASLLPTIVERVLAQNPGASFTCVTSQTAHSQFVQSMPVHLRPRVALEPWTSQEQLLRIIDQHGIFVFPTLFEGFGKAPFEAMARGLCVVCSDEGGMHDWVQTGLNGFRCEPGNIESFVETVNQILKDPSIPAKIAPGARSTALMLTWRRCALELEGFVRELQSFRAGANSA